MYEKYYVLSETELLELLMQAVVSDYAGGNTHIPAEIEASGRLHEYDSKSFEIIQVMTCQLQNNEYGELYPKNPILRDLEGAILNG